MFCPKCGNEIKDSINFCTNCGHQISGTNTSDKTKKKTSRLEKLLLVFFGIIVTFIFLGTYQKYRVSDETQSHAQTKTQDKTQQTANQKIISIKNTDGSIVKGTIQDLVKKAAEEANQSLPQQIDQETELATVIASGKTMQMKYRLFNRSLEEVDVEYFKETMKPVVRNMSCTNKHLADLFPSGLIIKQSYYDKDFRAIADFTIKGNECL